jgi:hypothetical protein
VSEAGDLLYVYRPGVRAALAAKSWRLRLAPALVKVRSLAHCTFCHVSTCSLRNPPLRRQARETGGYLVRVAFGATLLASIVIVRAPLCARSFSLATPC